VGKSPWCLRCRTCWTDHPHACGEKCDTSRHFFLVSGSSPRVWGKVDTPCLAHRPLRIIPTRVGKRRYFLIPRLLPPDHPHACGEKVNIEFRRPLPLGSSPRVWGKENSGDRYLYGARIIPTRVGKRTHPSNPLVQGADHPHACGEKFSGLLLFVSLSGSSPRVWGKGIRLLMHPDCLRIIPTRVGKSFPRGLWISSSTDHPHACGEKRRWFRRACG